MIARVDDDLGLSAELQLLSALRGEADLLANRYAPIAELQPAIPTNGGFNRRMLWQAAAVIVASVAILVWQFGRPWRAVVQPSEVASSRHADASPISGNAIVGSAAATAASAKLRLTAPDPIEVRRTQGIAEVGIDAPADRHPPANQLEMLRCNSAVLKK